MEGFRQLIDLHLADQGARDAQRSQERCRAELAALDETLTGARDAQRAAESELEGIESERRRLEGEVSGLEERKKKYRGQLMEAKSNEVYRTLLHEIETVGHEASEKETRILELMESADAAKARVEDASFHLREAEAASATAARRLEAEIERLEARGQAARAQVAQLRTAVPPRLLRVYDRILAGRDGKGMALAADGHCSECHVAVRPQAWVEILKQADVHHCSGCGRILYRAESVADPPAATSPSEAGGTTAPAGAES